MDICNSYSVRPIVLDQNRGSYVARNMAIGQSYGEYIGFIDASNRIPIKWAENSLKEIAASFDYIEGPIEVDISKIISLSHHWDAKHAFPVKPYMRLLNFAPTANLFIRRNIIEIIGGFDRRLKSGGDLEFGDRVARANFKQVYSYKIKVIHPPRDFPSIVRKIRRVKKGIGILVKLFLKRFSSLSYNVNTLIRRLTVLFIKDYGKLIYESHGLLFFGYLLEVISSYYSYKYLLLKDEPNKKDVDSRG